MESVNNGNNNVFYTSLTFLVLRSKIGLALNLLSYRMHSSNTVQLSLHEGITEGKAKGRGRKRVSEKARRTVLLCSHGRNDQNTIVKGWL